MLRSLWTLAANAANASIVYLTRTQLGVRMEEKDRVLKVHLRQLRGEHAYMAALLLEAVLSALWSEYGDDMADFQGRVFPDDPQTFINSN